MVMVFGEITTKANVDYEMIVRDTCRAIGFVFDDVGLDADNCKVLLILSSRALILPRVSMVTLPSDLRRWAGA
ncbi:hypothetical protein ACFX13_007960 [Malus domestica]